MSTFPIIVRVANKNDAKELSLMNNKFNGIKITENEISESLENNNELVVVAIIDERIIGFACAQIFKSFCYKAPYGEITEMFVKEAYRRKGVASALIKFLEEKLLFYGVDFIRILTRFNNEAAIRAYSLSGYIKEDEIFLKKDLMN